LTSLARGADFEPWVPSPDIGLFAHWWTGIAGNFTTRPIGETGVDQLFFEACAAFAISLSIALLA
jgi:hypothetical protein